MIFPIASFSFFWEFALPKSCFDVGFPNIQKGMIG